MFLTKHQMIICFQILKILLKYEFESENKRNNSRVFLRLWRLLSCVQLFCDLRGLKPARLLCP